MVDVIHFLSLYCRSALGTLPSQVSAAAFSNFYTSEIEPRFATTTGTGGIARHMVKILESKPDLVTLKTHAQVIEIKNAKQNPTVTYIKDQQGYRVRTNYVIYSAPMKHAPSIIEGFHKLAPEKTRLLQNQKYAHYTLHNIFVKGHPYRASFDTWVRAQDYSEQDFSDVILGRWMDLKINGYEDYRDFKSDPADESNVISIYHPLSLDEVGKGYTQQQAKKTATQAVKRFMEIFNPFLFENWGTQVEIQSVETHRWPYSIHIVEPGHFEFNSKILRKNIGKVFFANNNIGAPSLEEALFRGHCAVNNILNRMISDFNQESWTNCPLD